MKTLLLIGIGTGNPDHLTLEAIKAINNADLILIPNKGAGKTDLAELRHTLCADVLTNPATHIVNFDLPTRDPDLPNYKTRVNAWHDEIAECWKNAIAGAPPAETVALLIWGDPSLYDSTLRIAERLTPMPAIKVIPGITSLQALTASHAIPINTLAAPFTVTTGRQLRDHGWPDGAETLAVMLDAACSFQGLDMPNLHIWWGAYVGMDQEIIREGRLADVSDDIVATRARARAEHGWIMDIYVLRLT